MRKTKLTVVSILAFVAVIGLAWAVFVFGKSANDSEDLSIDLAGYTDAGIVEISDIKVGDIATTIYTLDETLPTITFKVKHTPPTSPHQPPSGTPTYVVATTIADSTLASYVTFSDDGDVQWTDDTESTVTITLTWVNKPTSVGTWETLNTAIQTAAANAKITIICTVTYP